MAHKKTIENFIKKAILKHGDKYDYSKSIYKGWDEDINIVCPTHGEFIQKVRYHIHGGYGCDKCARDAKKLTKEEFLDKAFYTHENKYDYSSIDYTDSVKKVDILCKIHGYFTQSPAQHINGNGCPKCSGNSKKTTKEFIYESKNIHGNKYDYSLTRYENNHTKVEIVCKKHGSFYQTPTSHLKGHGCQRCKNSKSENKIEKILQDNKIEYIREKRFDNCRYKNTLPFDFYLPKYNCCIEYDGIQHRKVVEKWGKHHLEETIIKDKIKSDFCLNNGIRLIRISDNVGITNLIGLL